MTEKLYTDFDVNFREIEDNISAAAKKSGRTRQDIILLAATKTVSPEFINYAIDSGISYIGENRVQEFLSKEAALSDKAHRHFIGHLQSNKAKDIVGRVEMIESVHSVKLARLIGKLSEEKGIVTDILLEVNIGREKNKSGFLKEELDKGNYTEHNLIPTNRQELPCFSIETEWEFYELYVCICENGN